MATAKLKEPSKSKAELKEAKRVQKENDNVALNWGASVSVIERGELHPISRGGSFNEKKRTTEPESSAPNPAQMILQLVKKERMWKSLTEFWQKLTNKKDVKSKINMNNPSSDLFWFFLWKVNFDVRAINKEFDSLFETFQENPNALTAEHAYMSRFFLAVWDTSRIGLLNWRDFSYGWTVAMYGSPEQAADILFEAIDTNKDGLIILEDIVKFMKIVFLTMKPPIKSSTLENAVRKMFAQMQKGDFDPCTPVEFSDFAKANPTSLMGTVVSILKYFSETESYSTHEPGLLEAAHRVLTKSSTYSGPKNKGTLLPVSITKTEIGPSPVPQREGLVSSLLSPRIGKKNKPSGSSSNRDKTSDAGSRLAVASLSPSDPNFSASASRNQLGFRSKSSSKGVVDLSPRDSYLAPSKK